jgi:hypothetical protein
MPLQYSLKAEELCNGFQLNIQAQFSFPSKSSEAFINGSLSAEFRSILYTVPFGIFKTE